MYDKITRRRNIVLIAFYLHDLNTSFNRSFYAIDGKPDIVEIVADAFRHSRFAKGTLGNNELTTFDKRLKYFVIIGFKMIFHTADPPFSKLNVIIALCPGTGEAFYKNLYFFTFAKTFQKDI